MRESPKSISEPIFLRTAKLRVGMPATDDFEEPVLLAAAARLPLDAHVHPSIPSIICSGTEIWF
jgi:hypothetical protein